MQLWRLSAKKSLGLKFGFESSLSENKFWAFFNFDQVYVLFRKYANFAKAILFIGEFIDETFYSTNIYILHNAG